MIRPPVGGRREFWVAISFVAATLVGAWITAGSAFLVGEVLRMIPNAQSLQKNFVAGCAVIVVVTEVASRPLQVPSRCWLIPRAWQARGAVTFAALFGVNLGLGWRTRVVSHSFWFLIALAIAAWDLSTNVSAFSVFALVRAVPVVILAHQADVTRSHSSIPDAKRLRELARDRTFLRFVTLLIVGSAVSLYA